MTDPNEERYDPSDFDHELSKQTDGALRVARRHYLRAGQRAQKGFERLGLEENGDFTHGGNVGNRGKEAVASAFQTAEMIENELDRRGADYKSQSEVLH